MANRFRSSTPGFHNKRALNATDPTSSKKKNGGKSLAFQDLVAVLCSEENHFHQTWLHIVDQAEQLIVFYQFDYLAAVPVISKCVRILQERSSFMEYVLRPTVFLSGMAVDPGSIRTVLGHKFLDSMDDLTLLLGHVQNINTDTAAAVGERCSLDSDDEDPSTVTGLPGCSTSVSENEEEKSEEPEHVEDSMEGELDDELNHPEVYEGAVFPTWDLCEAAIKRYQQETGTALPVRRSVRFKGPGLVEQTLKFKQITYQCNRHESANSKQQVVRNQVLSRDAGCPFTINIAGYKKRGLLIVRQITPRIQHTHDLAEVTWKRENRVFDAGQEERVRQLLAGGIPIKFIVDIMRSETGLPVIAKQIYKLRPKPLHAAASNADGGEDAARLNTESGQLPEFAEQAASQSADSTECSSD